MNSYSKKTIAETTVSSYSKSNSKAYEDPMNKNFLYGEITTKFLRKIKFREIDRFALDIGCGTGFVFDELYSSLEKFKISALGIEPAKGMLDIARKKYKNFSIISFKEGSFENIPCSDSSVDRIFSTLALHWVKDLGVAIQEMKRVLKPNGIIDILMIAKNDGDKFRKGIVGAMRKHMTFAQILESATLAQRVSPKQAEEIFSSYFNSHNIIVERHSNIIYGSFEEHMKWWKARSTQIISQVANKDQFIRDLREEFEKINSKDGIPFDSSYLTIMVKPKIDNKLGYSFEKSSRSSL